MIPKMRTINQCIQEVKEHDVDTALTKHALRHLIATEKLPVSKIGNKTLINMDVLDKVLHGERADYEEQSGQIRKLSENIE